jgi:hypothetical protein
MILLTLTTEGGSREDGNAYYARHLLVDVEDTTENHNQMARVLCDVLHGDYIGDQITFPAHVDAQAQAFFDSPYSLALLLSDRGFPAAVMAPIFVVSEEE